MLWFLYNALFAVGYVLVLPKFLLRMWRRGGYRRGFLQRLAIYPDGLLRKIRQRPRVWVHAVSVGEVYVALRYMRELARLRPDLGFVLSTTTSTGHRVAEAGLGPEDVLLYYPADFPHVVGKTLDAVRPRGLLLTESEIWPNMIRAAAARGIPVVIINGRISESSFRGYRLLRPFFSRVFRAVDLAMVQTESDRLRLLALGAAPERVRTMGTAKYDVAEADAGGESEVRGLLGEMGWGEATLLLGGSTWPGEEGVLLDIYARLRRRHEALRLILAPRHAERGPAVAGDIRARGLHFARRSRWPQPEEMREGGGEVLLVDTTGELRHFYACAHVIFVGKSLTNRGGQNIIEPALAGKPVVVGPHMENFPDVLRDFLDAEALIQVRDAAELEQALRRLIEEPSRRASLGARARRLVESKRGVVRAGARLAAEALARV